MVASLPEQIGELRRVAIATDESDDALARVRRVALALARTHGFEVVLYDRSHERWTDHPHPVGPVDAEEIDEHDRPHLVHQLREFTDAGVGATAWLATVPAITAMLDLFQTLEVDAVMLPEQLDDPKMADRLQTGDSPGETVQRVAGLSLERPPLILSVPESGPITIVEFDGAAQ
jgi:hypothetical protein